MKPKIPDSNDSNAAEENAVDSMYDVFDNELGISKGKAPEENKSEDTNNDAADEPGENIAKNSRMI